MKNFKGVVFALISSGTFGLVPLFSLPLMISDLRPEQAAVIGVPTILFYRFLFSSITMGAVSVYKRINLRVDFKSLIVLFVLALLYAATAKFIVDSYEYIDSGLSTTVHFLYPIFVSFVMVFFFKEKISILLFLASILSIVGVGFMCWHGEVSNELIAGLLLAGLTIVTYGLYIAGLNKSSIAAMNVESVTFYVLVFGCGIFLLYALLTTGIDRIYLPNDWFNLIMLGFFATFISDLTLVLAVKYAGATITSILGSMEPVVAVLVGYLFFQEYFGLESAIGLTLVLIGVVLVIVSNSKKKGVSIEATKVQ